MRKIQQDDMKAFDVLYSRYRTPLFSFLAAQVNASVAEELMQEIFIKFLNGRMGFRQESKVSTWLWTITRNTLIDHWRSSGRKIDQSSTSHIDEDGNELLEADIDEQETLILKKTTQKQLETCLEELPLQQKEAILLHTQSDLSHKEMADILKVSISAIKSLLFRAKEKLINCFKLGGHL